ncbi:DUF3237 domain-containing protein [Pararhodobacter aggregans]|nr:DUF3237 domain-containing protein [Pararhodobacter aggregans]PTX04968.1 uncharacterized protein DUF3237 [Pararhodobacter aggregans]
MDILDRLPAPVPQTRLLWEALVDLQDRTDLGIGPLGPRGIIPITGGRFRGAPGFEALSGTVLPGGADRQQVRPDGARELDALYEMQVADGAILTIRNRVIIDESVAGPRYAIGRVQVIAPEGRWGWLNRRVFVGTMASARPERAAVVIRVWLVEEHPVASSGA